MSVKLELLKMRLESSLSCYQQRLEEEQAKSHKSEWLQGYKEGKEIVLESIVDDLKQWVEMV